MKRTCFAFFALLLASAVAAHADQTTATVQRALKDQGFYYGDVSGQKNADTTAAIRRYQIRNGLQITGAIDAETLRSLGVGNAGGAAAPSPPEAAASPAESLSDEDNVGQSAEIAPERAPSNEAPPPAPNGDYAPGSRGSRSEVSGVFAGTPYEIAPPDVQRHVIVGAQALLARAGYFRSGIDGHFGPGTAAAVRAFQSQTGIAPSGRLNMETLSALGLLPGQHAPGIQLRRRPLLRRPVYRGQWIPG